MKSRILLSVVAFLAASPIEAGAMAGPRVFNADYTVSFLGLKIARSSFTTSLDGPGYAVKGRFSSAGVAALFDSTNGTADLAGRVGSQGYEPSSYALRYVYGKRKSRTDITFGRGTVTSAENAPASTAARAADYIPVTKDDLRAALDPLSALMVRADAPDAVCRRTLRVFDGETRVDLALSPAGVMPFEAAGFKGEAVRCKVRFIPLAGYRKSREAIEFLRSKAALEIAFADTGVNGVWAPVSASIGTQVGTVRIRATRFGEN